MIAIISATNRLNSYTEKVTTLYTNILSEFSDEPIFRYSLKQLPENFILTDLYGSQSEAFKPVREAMREADKFLFVVPEYNGSFPGILKTFIDSFPPQDTFYGKKAALVGLAKGKFGNLRGLDHLVCVLNYLRVSVLPNRVHLIAIHRIYDEVTRSLDPTNTEDIRTHIQQFIRF